MSGEHGRHSFVVVANRLPVDRCGDSWHTSPGGLVTALAPVVRQREGAWIGWSGSCDEVFAPFEAEGMSLVPVALSSEEFGAYYEGCCNATIWPLYHDQVVAPQFRSPWWNSYRQINERFAEAVVATAAADATVWIHDFQLQLVPRLVREQRPDLSIGFFNHIPFPSLGLFSQLPWRDDVLEGLLGADVIGFQRASDVVNFTAALERLAPSRSTALPARTETSPSTTETEPSMIEAEPSTIEAAPQATDTDSSSAMTEPRIRCYPISIDAAAVSAAARSEEVAAEARSVREDLGSPTTLLLGVDRLDHTKGILERLFAYEELLDEGVLDPLSTRLVQVAVPSREGVPAYRELRDDVEHQVGRINGKFAAPGGTVVHYLHRSYSLASTIALYLAADVLLVTSLRDGMNLVAKEFVVARRGRGGGLVLSEFAGAADELTGAHLVNPHDRAGLKTAIANAATMDDSLARARMDAMAEVVAGHDVHAWAYDFLTDLETRRHVHSESTGTTDGGSLETAMSQEAQ